MTKKPKNGGDYEVGYGKPPKHGQFKKGQSGNPKGRAPGTQNIHSLIEKVGAELITVTQKGDQRVITKTEASIMALYSRSMKGDTRAFKILMEAERMAKGAIAGEVGYELAEADLDALKDHADWRELIERAEREVNGDETD